MGGVTRMVKMAPAKPWAACGAHPLGAERATRRIFSMNDSPFPLQRLLLCQSALTLSEQKLARKWAWLDSRITVNILSTPGSVAVCILEPEKPKGLEIRYV